MNLCFGGIYGKIDVKSLVSLCVAWRKVSNDVVFALVATLIKSLSINGQWFRLNDFGNKVVWELHSHSDHRVVNAHV